MERYSTNLTDKLWQVIEKIVNPQERKRKHSLRNIMNAILYLLKTGCQWRMIPKDFAPWESVSLIIKGFYVLHCFTQPGRFIRMSTKFLVFVDEMLI